MMMVIDGKQDTVLVIHHQNEIEFLSKTLSTFIPELVSRIDHAARALFTEISRGFFLPFCTVAASALARIRFLIVQGGYESIMDMHKLGVTLSHQVVKYYDDAVKEDNNEIQDIERTRNLRLLAESIGIAWTGGKVKKFETMSKTMNIENVEDDSRISRNAKNDNKSSQVLDETFIGAMDDIGIRFQSNTKNSSVIVPIDHVDYNLKIMMQRKVEESRSNEKAKKRKVKKSELSKSQRNKKRMKKKNDFLDELFKR
jgi:hypothetical protein